MKTNIDFPGKFGFALWGIRLDTPEPTWHPIMRLYPQMFEYWVPSSQTGRA